MGFLFLEEIYSQNDNNSGPVYQKIIMISFGFLKATLY